MLNSLYIALLPLLKNDNNATSFCIDLMSICQVWDDLIDNDDCKDDDINGVFDILLFRLPVNPFYLKYQSSLMPLIMNAKLKWMDANKMENEKQGEDLHMAYMLRAEIYSIFAYVAFLVGGFEYYNEVGVEIRRLYGEKMSEFIEEMQNA